MIHGGREVLVTDQGVGAALRGLGVALLPPLRMSFDRTLLR